MAAVFLLYKGVTAFFSDGHSAPSNARTIFSVLLLGLLLAGITVAARLPHLVKTSGLRWHVLALLAFAALALPVCFVPPPGIAEFLGPKLVATFGGSHPKAGVIALFTMSMLIALSGWVTHGQPRWARRALIGSGAAVVLGIVFIRMWAAQSDQPQWPVLLAGLAFLYLWWLGVLLFDLAFVWHRYIRHSVAVHALTEWNRGRDAWPKYTLRKNPLAPEPGKPGKPGIASA